MIGISCLVKNTALATNLKDMVEYIGYSQVAAGKDASISSVYNIIRKSGIEVDMNSVGHLYNEVLPKTYREFSSDNEVNERVLHNFNEAIRQAADLEDKTGEKQIGEAAPEQHVATGIVNMFTNANIKDETTKSDMRELQDALWKGVKRKLNLKEETKPTTKEAWTEVLSRALGYEKIGIRDVNGKLNGITDLYSAMKDELSKVTNKLLEKGDFDVADRWLDMTDKLQASTYNLLFSEKEAKDLLHGILKQGGFVKELSNGQQVINWNKLAGDVGDIQTLRNNVESVLAKNGFNNEVIKGVMNSLSDEFEDLLAETNAKALKQLEAKDKSIGKISEQNSDLKRLSQLNNLGVFSGQFDRVLNNLLKTSDLQQADMADLKQLADAASNLYREIDNKFGSPIFASRHLQTLQKLIDGIIARNINNKAATVKAVGVAQNFTDVLLTGMLMRPFTILENQISGMEAVVEPLILGKMGLKTEDFELYGSMLSHVASTGQAFGEEVGNFSPQELFTNTLKWKWDGATKTERAKSILHLLMLPGRIGLTGFDSANKVTITNSVFKNAIYKALTQNQKKPDGTIVKGKSKDEAIKILNEALYGKSWEQAKKDAKSMIEKINNDLPEKFKINTDDQTVNTFANDLVKANLNANGAISNDVIEAAFKSAYHVAGYGLGHEANNGISKAVRQYRNARKQKEGEIIKDENWNKLALHRLGNVFINGGILRFIGGATNWVRLRFEKNLGLGLVSGFTGKWNSDIDFADKRSIQKSLTEMQNARNAIGRAIIGASITMFAYTIGFGLFRLLKGNHDDPDKKAKLAELQKRRDRIAKQRAESGESVKKYNKLQDLDADIKDIKKQLSYFEAIKGNWMGNRLFKKLVPDIMLFHYYADTDKNIQLAVMDYVSGTTNFGSNYSMAAQMKEMATQFYKGNTDAGYGQMSNIIGSRVGLPVWQAYKDWYKLTQWVGSGFSADHPHSDFKQPTNFTEGLLGGGMLEDIGAFKRNSNITMLPGIGGVALDKFKAHGVETMEDLKKNPNWYKMKDKDGSYILDGDSRVKAQAAAKKYFDQQ